MGYNYSALSTANRCMQLYHYQYVQNLQPEGGESGDMAFGSALHAALSSSLTDQDNPAIDVFRTYWNSYKDKPVNYSRYKWDELGQMGEVFIQRFEKFHKKHFEVVQSEERLFGELNQFKIEGTPDTIAKYKGTLSIVDFKSSGYPYDKERILIAEQLAMYRILASKVLGLNATQLVYMVFIKGTAPRIQVLTHQPSSEEMAQFQKNILDSIEKLERAKKDGNYPRNTGSCIVGTMKCAHFHRCYGKISVDNHSDES